MVACCCGGQGDSERQRGTHSAMLPFLNSWQESMFRFSPGREVAVIAGQSSGRQESIGVFTQPGRLTGREFTDRLPGSARIYPLLRPVAGQ